MVPPRSRIGLLALTPILLSLFASCSGGDPDPSHHQETSEPELAAHRKYFPTAVRARKIAVSEFAASRSSLKAIESKSGVLGYVVDEQVVSRSGPFTIRVVVGRNFRVVSARVLEYSADRGRGVRRASFSRQFSGKGPDDPIRIGKDIDAVTGATLSSRSMAGGVRRAIELAQKAASQAMDR